MSAMVDPEIIDVVNQVQMATLAPQVVLTSGAGKAYQLAAQACALAVQDAVDALRNATTIANAASGAAMARYLATGEDRYLRVVDAAQALVKASVVNLTDVGQAASATLQSFPSG